VWRRDFCGRYVIVFCGCFADSTRQIKDARPSGLLDTAQSCRNSISARRCRHSRNYPAVIVRAAIVAVINQPLTLPFAPRVAIYAEYVRAGASREFREGRIPRVSGERGRDAKSVITSSLRDFAINARLIGATRRYRCALSFVIATIERCVMIKRISR